MVPPGCPAIGSDTSSPSSHESDRQRANVPSECAFHKRTVNRSDSMQRRYRRWRPPAMLMTGSGMTKSQSMNACGHMIQG